MDFIPKIPENSENTVIWEITYLFSKQVHFVPWQKIPSIHTLAKLFIHHIYRLQGALLGKFSNHGVQFTSKFWQKFLKLLVTFQGLSSSHHPETNGGCECMNGVLEQCLRC